MESLSFSAIIWNFYLLRKAVFLWSLFEDKDWMSTCDSRQTGFDIYTHFAEIQISNIFDFKTRDHQMEKQENLFLFFCSAKMAIGKLEEIYWIQVLNVFAQNQRVFWRPDFTVLSQQP